MTGKRRAAAAATFGLIALMVGGAVAASARGEGEWFEIALWANDDSVDRLPDLVATSEHPCGAIAVMRVQAMPPHQEPEGALAPERVAEIDADGRTLRQWSAPVDYRPLAIRGEALLLEHGDGRLLIGIDGSLSRGDPDEPLSEIESLVCPGEAPLDDSDYRQCGVLRDLESGARRLIAYESECT